MDKQKTSETWTISEEYDCTVNVPAEAESLGNGVHDLVFEVCQQFTHVTVEVTVKGWDE